MPEIRSATLRVAHQRRCPNVSRTSLGSLDGCSCRPSYYTFHRDQNAKPVKGARVRDRQVAERALRKLLVLIDEGRAGFATPARKPPTFDAWCEIYLENLARDKGNKGSTIRAYQSTLGYARPILGGLRLDEIEQPELRRVLRALRERGGADATVYKHLRHLRAILNAAVEEGHAIRNPLTRKFVKDLRLRVPRGVEAYTDAELAGLWAEMQQLRYRDVYVFVAKAAVVTGARLGELIALDWDDLDLSTRRLRIQRHWDPVDGATLPKDREPRTVNLIPDAVVLFEHWVAVCGVLPGNSPLFVAPVGKHGRLNGQYVSRLVDAAREKAGLSAVGEGGRPRKPFHAFRATFDRLCRERGLDPQWVQHQLGHSDPTLTLNVYGRWSDAAMQAEAARAEAFPV